MSFYLFLKRLLDYTLSKPSGGGIKAAGPKGRSIEGDEMVQDPHCKVYVPLERAIKKKIGGETLHFCSEECAKNFLREEKIR